MTKRKTRQKLTEAVRKLNLRAPEPEPEAPEVELLTMPPTFDDGNGNGGIEDQPLPFPPPAMPPLMPSVAPETASSQRTRFESPVREDVLVTSHETMENLSQFFGNLPDRERFDVAVWRCDPQSPQNQRKRAWKGRVPLPTSYTLEEGIDREFGGGVYYWRLGFEGRHASRADLPADYQALPMAGYIRLETAAKSEEESPGVDPQLEARLQKAEGAQSELLSFLKEMVRDKKDSASKDSNAMTSLMTVVLAANQSQMQAMQQQAANQQQFLLAMLTMTEKKASEAREQKDGMMQLMMEAVRGETSGEKSMSTTLIENLPRILEGLAKVPGLAQPSPRMAPPIQLPPAPASAPAPVPVRPPAIVTVGPSPVPANPDDYPTVIAKRCIAGWQNKEAVGVCADAIEELGSDENFNDLMDTDQAQVIAFLAMGFKAANNIDCPEELQAYARAVLEELAARYPDEPEKTPAVTVVPVPVPVIPVSNAQAQGQAAG